MYLSKKCKPSSQRTKGKSKSLRGLEDVPRVVPTRATQSSPLASGIQKLQGPGDKQSHRIGEKVISPLLEALGYAGAKTLTRLIKFILPALPGCII